MRTVVGSTLTIGFLYIVVGCALSGTPVPQTQLAETEAMIRSAESAGAFEHASALLQKARQTLGAAQRATGKGDHSEARQYLLETTTYAEAARARAQAEQQKKETAKVRQQADELEVKAEVIQKQLQVPQSGAEMESDK
ncbi:MAG: DUF4398 domain-containing protein [Nitrospira sp.]|nr:DUF4398 domain-containing protein [Nitrospira sp.]